MLLRIADRARFGDTFRSMTAGELSTTPAHAGSLVRRGYLTSAQNSERVRGERRMTWADYRITEAGREAVK